MEWLTGGTGSPNPPVNLRFEVNSSTGKYELHWDKPAPTVSGDTAFVYVVYRSENNPPNILDSTNIFGLTGTTFLSSTDARYSVTKGDYYCVSAITRYSNESASSNIVSLNMPSLTPGDPQLVTPANGSHDLALSATLVWSGDSNSERYIVQVAEDSTFNSDIDLGVWEYRNTQIQFRSVVPGNTYYWRVKAFGQVGESEYSDIYSFRSGIPIPPVLNYPPHATLNVPLTPDFNWFSSEGATSYKFQLTTTVQFTPGTIIIDQTVTDTAFSVTTPLIPNKNYWWRVSAINTYGQSFWPTGFGFKTTPVSSVELEGIPTELSLEQNYPNPFNPTTEIEFSIIKQGFVSLKVYDLLGREVANLINEELNAGKYSVVFDASQLASGTYIYHLNVDGLRFSKKMILLK